MKPGLVLVPGDVGGIDLIGSAAEERAEDQLEEAIAGDAVGFGEHHRLRHGLDRHRDHHVACDLRGIRGGRLATHIPDPSPDDFKDRPHLLDRLRASAGENVELPLGGDVRSAEDGRGNVADIRPIVRRDQFAREGDRDRRCDDMDQPRPGGRKETGIENDAADRIIIRKHGERRIRIEGLGGGGHHRHAIHGTAGAVPGPHGVAGGGKVLRHRASHGAEADETDLHDAHPFQYPAVRRRGAATTATRVRLADRNVSGAVTPHRRATHRQKAAAPR